MADVVNYLQIIEQMKRMRQHKVPIEIDLIIYQFAHRDLMKQLNQEYHEKVKVCDCNTNKCENGVCTGFIKVRLVKKTSLYQEWDYVDAFNHRQIIKYRHIYDVVYDKYNHACCKLPKNY